MRDLLTGAEGLVGSAIRRLAPKNRDLISITRSQVDLTDFQRTLRMVEEIRPDRIFHAAGAVGGLGGNMKHPGEMFRRNILINFNIMEAARLCRTKKLISFMSTCIYPSQTSYPIKARSLHDGPPHYSNFAYAHAKRMQDIQSQAYRTEYGCNFITAVGTNLFGISDNFNLEDGHAVASLIHKIFLAKQNKTPVTVWGSGSPLREFVFADDIAQLSYWAMDHYDSPEPIIFSNGAETSIRELVSQIADCLEFKGEIIFDESKPDGQLRKPSDTAQLQKLHPRFQFTDLRIALQQTIDWFLKTYPNVRK